MNDHFMLWVSQLIFGLVQGLTEVFPISSSAHTAIGQALWEAFSGQSTVTFSTSVFLHLGTSLVIVFVCQRDLFLLCRSATHTVLHHPLRWKGGPTKEHPLGQQTPFYMSLGVLITGVIGLVLKRAAVDVFSRPHWAAVFLPISGLCLLTASWHIRSRSKAIRGIADLEWWHYVVIGAAQGLAVIPGLSRFGLTLTAGLLCDLAWYQALRLSFLLSLPTVLAGAGLELSYAYRVPTSETVLPTILGVASAALGAWMAIQVIRREDLHAQRALAHFGAYCLAAGPFYFLFLHYLGP
ncbi:MAG: hypothetical protein AMJ93_11865 [Anaerolineae bacterium SM23_84]|nr:MAG: hypothetical protein AMJ93_11865 [Anaerolineae bacterium SM23_84]